LSKLKEFLFHDIRTNDIQVSINITYYRLIGIKGLAYYRDY